MDSHHTNLLKIKRDDLISQITIYELKIQEKLKLLSAINDLIAKEETPTEYEDEEYLDSD